jgi:hypothetical protein
MAVYFYVNVYAGIANVVLFLSLVSHGCILGTAQHDIRIPI